MACTGVNGRALNFSNGHSWSICLKLAIHIQILLTDYVGVIWWLLSDAFIFARTLGQVEIQNHQCQKRSMLCAKVRKCLKKKTEYRPTRNTSSWDVLPTLCYYHFILNRYYLQSRIKLLGNTCIKLQPSYIPPHLPIFHATPPPQIKMTFQVNRSLYIIHHVTHSTVSFPQGT